MPAVRYPAAQLIDKAKAAERWLRMKMPRQSQPLWCWAAVAAALHNFYVGASGPVWTQCRVAGRVLGVHSCCQAPADCNQARGLRQVLVALNMHRSDIEGPTNGATVVREIDSKRPLAARVLWDGDVGHFVLIAGYQRLGDDLRVVIEDPQTGTGTAMLSAIQRVGGYRGARWTHTYFTKAGTP